MANSKVSLKLLIDRSSHKVLFAEAGKVFVDFMLYLSELPLDSLPRNAWLVALVICTTA